MKWLRICLCVCVGVEQVGSLAGESFSSRAALLALIGTHIGLAGGTVVLRVAGTVRAVQAQGAGPAAADGGESEGS